MKHFIVEITYSASLDAIDKVVAQHRAHLKTGYDRKMLLMSGPQDPRVGGIVVARAESRSEIEAFFAADPYQVAGVAKYRFIEFKPAGSQPELEKWI